jgi:hypothetical protein
MPRIADKRLDRTPAGEDRAAHRPRASVAGSAGACSFRHRDAATGARIDHLVKSCFVAHAGKHAAGHDVVLILVKFRESLAPTKSRFTVGM